MMDVFMIGLWAYGGAGFVVALAFVLYGIDRIDPAAKGAYAVRPLLMPGLVVLWPLVLARWATLARQKDDAP
jgi:hypothetical protein